MDILNAHPLAAFGITFVTGFLDGVNPCAIATLLLFVSALLATVGNALSLGSWRAARARIWLVSGAYILGVFGLYFGLGFGLVQFSSLRIFGNTHIVTRVAAGAAVVLGLLLLYEVFNPDTKLRLGMPRAFYSVVKKWRNPSTVGAAAVGGVLIGLCTIPCGGAVYLAAASVMASVGSPLMSYGLLTTYNVAFIMPLVLLVAIAGNRRSLTRLERWHVRSRLAVKGVMGGVVIAIGLFTLYII